MSVEALVEKYLEHVRVEKRLAPRFGSKASAMANARAFTGASSAADLKPGNTR